MVIPVSVFVERRIWHQRDPLRGCVREALSSDEFRIECFRRQYYSMGANGRHTDSLL